MSEEALIILLWNVMFGLGFLLRGRLTFKAYREQAAERRQQDTNQIYLWVAKEFVWTGNFGTLARFFFWVGGALLLFRMDIPREWVSKWPYALVFGALWLFAIDLWQTYGAHQMFKLRRLQQ